MPKSRPPSRINKKFVEMREKEAEALRLVKAGYRLPEIAQRLGYSGRQGAHRLITKALQSLVEQPREEVRQIAVARLDHMLTRIVEQIEAGDLKAIQVALKIEERRARLLGLDAPVSVANASGAPVSFVVLMPPQAASVADWQAQVAGTVIDVTPKEEPPALADNSGDAA